MNTEEQMQAYALEAIEAQGVLDEREAFEKYMASTYPGVNLIRRIDGEYWSTVPDNFWDGWQARAALASAYPAPQASEVQQEPVAWRTFDGEGGYEYRAFDHNEDYAAEWAKRNPKHAGWVEPLYTQSAQQAKPLSDEQIRSAWKAWNRTSITSADRAVEFVRSIYASDGIKE